MEDDPSVLAGTFKSRRILEQSEAALEEMTDAFNLLAQRMKSDENDVTSAELSKAKSNLASARMHVVDEVTKHEKRILQSQGLVADAPIDFDRMRFEIGRRLDRIRDARRAEGLSDEPVEQ